MTPPDPVEEIRRSSSTATTAFVAPTMLTFENGARVVLNPTAIADNDIYFSATSPGGLSLVDDADVPDALNAVAVVTSSGIGELDAVQLDTVLSGAAIELYPSIGQTSEDFVGTSTTDDLELLLQLVNLYMSAPRVRSGRTRLDGQVVAVLRRRSEQRSRPGRVHRVLRRSVRRRATLPGDPDGRRARRSRSRRPSSGCGAIGSRTPATGCSRCRETSTSNRRPTSPAILRHTRRAPIATETFKDFQPDPTSRGRHQGRACRHRRQGFADDRLEHADPQTETPSPCYADVLTSVLNIRLTDHIREELGASYSPSAFVGINTEPDQLVETYLNVTGDPATIPEISTFVIDDVTSLRTIRSDTQRVR